MFASIDPSGMKHVRANAKAQAKVLTRTQPGDLQMIGLKAMCMAYIPFSVRTTDHKAVLGAQHGGKGLVFEYYEARSSDVD